MGLIDEAMGFFSGKPSAPKKDKETLERERLQREQETREKIEMMKNDVANSTAKFRAEMKKPLKDRDMSIISGKPKGKDDAWE